MLNFNIKFVKKKKKNCLMVVAGAENMVWMIIIWKHKERIK